MDPDIQVQHSGIVRLRAHTREDGTLVSLDGGEPLPFPLMDVYYLTGLKEGVRGKHAHKTRDQVIVCAKGAFDLELDDGTAKQTIRLDDPSLGIRLGPLLWHSMKSFTDDCTIIVFASQTYDESDYLRSYEEFTSYLSTHGPLQ